MNIKTRVNPLRSLMVAISAMAAAAFNGTRRHPDSDGIPNMFHPGYMGQPQTGKLRATGMTHAKVNRAARKRRNVLANQKNHRG